MCVLTSNHFQRFPLIQSLGDIATVEKSGRFDVYVAFKSLLMRFGELSDDICNHSDSEIKMKVTNSNVPRCVVTTM
jgi:hypothetical protein